MTGDLLVPGTPTVRTDGHPTFAGIQNGSGNAQPTNYQITLSGNTAIRNVVLRTDPILISPVPAPPQPTGTRTVTLNAPNQTIGDPATLLDLTLGGNAGAVAVPAGAYGNFSADGGGSFVFGVAGATAPAVYNLQSLTLAGGTQLQVVGPVVINLAGGLTANGVVGNPNHSAWLKLTIAAGDLTLNGGGAIHGHVIVPAGTTTIKGNSSLTGGLATDRLALNGNGAIQVVPDVPPQISLTTPADGAVFLAPAAITVAAAASDADGTVAKVEFYQGTTKIGEALNAPYQIAWNNVPYGTYTLTAVATDNLGVSTTSAPVSIISNAPPTVALTAPAGGTVFIAPATILLAASAADVDGSVAKVGFYQGTVNIGEATAAPYQFSWNNVPAGTYALTAMATDNLGASTVSTPVTIRVDAPPTVTLTAPAAGATFTAPATVTLNATAADSDGTVTKVEFYQGAVKIGEADSAPYQITWSGAAAGAYTLTAMATDDAGATATSAPVSITINTSNSSVTTADLQNTPWPGTDAYKTDRILLVRDVIAKANQPIAFYGQIIDQNGQPVPGVNVAIGVRWTQEVLPGDSEDTFVNFNLITDGRGLFQLTGTKGSLLGVDALVKDGYEAPPYLNGRSYWYWAPTPDMKFTPDPNKPEIFQMWQKAGGQKLTVQHSGARVSYDGTVITLDLMTGRKVSTGGDLQVSLVRNPLQVRLGQNNYEWTATLTAVEGGLIASNDVFMYLAPESGYQPQLVVHMAADDPHWSPAQNVSFYLKSRGGQNYGRVRLNITTLADDRPWAGFSLESYLNPTGSRNLEYDPYQNIQPLNK